MNLRHRWQTVRGSFWFLPSALVLASVALAASLISLGLSVDVHISNRWPLLFGAGAAGARGLLSAVATSMITVAGVVFSITIVALALTSSQYSSRVLSNFMRDRVNQTVLGVFVGIFAYCVVVLRTIRGGDEGAFVPSLAVLGALVLAFVGIGCLIHFIHHIAIAIQASSIIATVARETVAAIKQRDSEPMVSMKEGSEPAFGAGTAWTPVLSSRTGYVADVDARALRAVAANYGLIVRMDAGIGDFVVEDTALASLAPGERATASAAAAVRSAYEVERQRNVQADPSYGIRQIVDIALRALSSASNDSTTAVMCIDYLSAILFRLSARRIGAAPSFPEAWRVIPRGPDFGSMLDEAFDQIRQNAGGNTAVLTRLAESLATIAWGAGSMAHLSALGEQAERVGAVARSTIVPECDLRPVEFGLARTARVLLERTAQLGG